ncbi:MAG: division/cell wall cluster transcriptional repressor MraZ [Sphingobacteriales bacterium]|nr:MAG: division/cell wall cluster transcriptional repressor MraZ [Sphingobacteriales bacterium]
MLAFTGHYEVKIDAKGRLKLPVDLLRQIPDETKNTYVLNKGLDNCLRLYPIQLWNQVTKELSRLSTFRTNERQFLRFFYQDATNIELDSSDRILIPKRLQEKVDIQSDIVILAYHDTIEIWSKAVYDSTIKEPENYADMADNILSSLNQNNH